jgi:hypothetical protein
VLVVRDDIEHVVGPVDGAMVPEGVDVALQANVACLLSAEEKRAVVVWWWW